MLFVFRHDDFRTASSSVWWFYQEVFCALDFRENCELPTHGHTTVIGVRGRHAFRIRLFALYHEKVNKGELWRVSCGRITSYSQICALVGFSSKSSINGWDGYFFVFSASSQVVLRPNRLEVKTKSLSLLDSIEGYICSYILCCLYLAKIVDGTLLKSCNFCNSKPMIHFISYW